MATRHRFEYQGFHSFFSFFSFSQKRDPLFSNFNHPFIQKRRFFSKIFFFIKMKRYIFLTYKMGFFCQVLTKEFSIKFYFSLTFSLIFLFVDTGRLIYEWDQTLEELNIFITPPEGLPASAIDCVITPTHLRLGIKGNPPFIDVLVFPPFK